MPPITRSITCGSSTVIDCDVEVESLFGSDTLPTCDGASVSVTTLSEAVGNEFVTADLGSDVFIAGPYSSIPFPEIAGRLFLATDLNGGTLFRDSGVAWVQAAGPVTPLPSANLYLWANYR